MMFVKFHLDSGDKSPLDHLVNVLHLVLLSHSNVLSILNQVLINSLPKSCVANLECHLQVSWVIITDVDQGVVVDLINILHVIQGDLFTQT